MKTHDDVIREFWSMFLGIKIEKDGQTKGFRNAWNDSPSEHQRQADRYAEACWTKIERDGRDADECVSSAVEALRRELRALPDPEPEHRSKPAHARFRFDLIQRILTEKLKPIDTARILEEAADRFPEITLDECHALRLMGDWWQPLNGPPIERPTWWDRHQEIEAALKHAPLKELLEVLKEQGPPPNEGASDWV